MRYRHALFAACIISALLFVPYQTLIVRARASKRLQKRLPDPVVALQWSQRVNSPTSIVFSPDGRYIASISAGGGVRCFSSDGKLVWKTLIKDANRVSVGNDGAAAVYSFLNPLKRTVHFISSTGVVRWKHEVTGGVWCCSASSTEGEYAFGTGERYCYTYSIREHRHRYRRWRIAGVPCSLEFAPGGERIYAGTWQDAGIGIFRKDGTRLSWETGRGDRLHLVDYCDGSGYVLTMGKPNRNIPEADIIVRRSDLGRVWARNLKGISLVADLDVSSGMVIVGYSQKVRHKNDDMLEPHIDAYDQDGNRVWQKGGAFEKWTLVEISRAGYPIVRDNQSIYILDRQGNARVKKKVASQIVASIQDPQRRRFLLYTADGQLHMFSVK